MDKLSFDIRVADFLRRCFAFYIRKRLRVTTLIDIETQQNEAWDSLFSGNTSEYVYSLSVDTKIILHKDSMLCKYIYFGFEEEEVEFLRKYLKAGDNFIDIGSNVGLYSLIAAELIGNTGTVLAFEPTPETFARLIENISINNIKIISANNIGLSDRSGRSKLYTSKDGFDAWNSFAKLPQLENSSETMVAISTLDDILAINQKKMDVSLIKLDVEGWEYFVLQGSKDLLSKSDAPVIMVEFNEVNAFSAGYYCGNIYDLLKEYGYEWYKYDSISNSLIAQPKKLHYACENLIAVKDIEKVIFRISDN